jgi:hypothetical protein
MGQTDQTGPVARGSELVMPQAPPQQAVPGTVPSPQVAAPPGADGVAPLPWEIVAATQRAQPAGWVTPLKGPAGHSMAVGGIATLLAALWLIVTVQKHRKRRMEV